MVGVRPVRDMDRYFNVRIDLRPDDLLPERIFGSRKLYTEAQ